MRLFVQVLAIPLRQQSVSYTINFILCTPPDAQVGDVCRQIEQQVKEDFAGHDEGDWTVKKLTTFVDDVEYDLRPTDRVGDVFDDATNAVVRVHRIRLDELAPSSSLATPRLQRPAIKGCQLMHKAKTALQSTTTPPQSTPGRMPRWSASELVILEGAVSAGKLIGSIVEENLLPGRSWKSIKNKMNRLRGAQTPRSAERSRVENDIDKNDDIEDVEDVENLDRADEAPLDHYDPANQARWLGIDAAARAEWTRKAMEEESAAREEHRIASERAYARLMHTSHPSRNFRRVQSVDLTDLESDVNDSVEAESADEEIVRFATGSQISSNSTAPPSTPPRISDHCYGLLRTPSEPPQSTLGSMRPPWPSSGHVRSESNTQRSEDANNDDLDLNLDGVPVIPPSRARQSPRTPQQMPSKTDGAQDSARAVTTPRSSGRTYAIRSDLGHLDKTAGLKRGRSSSLSDSSLSESELPAVLTTKRVKVTHHDTPLRSSPSRNPVQHVIPATQPEHSTSVLVSTDMNTGIRSDPVPLLSKKRSSSKAQWQKHFEKEKAALQIKLAEEQKRQHERKHRERRVMRKMSIPVSPHESDSARESASDSDTDSD